MINPPWSQGGGRKRGTHQTNQAVHLLAWKEEPLEPSGYIAEEDNKGRLSVGRLLLRGGLLACLSFFDGLASPSLPSHVVVGLRSLAAMPYQNAYRRPASQEARLGFVDKARSMLD